MRSKFIMSLLAVALLSVGSSGIGMAYSPAIQPFPIGIFWPPSPADTTNANYADIAGMNANFIVGGNGVSDYASNDAALGYAAAHGLTLLADDSRLAWRSMTVDQHATGHGLFVSSSVTLGQTFKTPQGTGWGLNTITMYIDKLNWPAGTALTLTLYDSPSKQSVLASDTITGPVPTYNPTFQLHAPVSSDTSYYFELSSDQPGGVGWVVTSSADVYGDGRAYRAGVAQNTDFWFELGFAQRAYNDGNQPGNSDIDQIASHYRTHAALQGYHVLDEPSVLQMTMIQDTIRRLKNGDPDHMSFVNLFPNYASASQLGLNQMTGEYVTSSVPLGQAFRTRHGQTYIETVQWWIDKNTWGAGEALTLSLWDSSAKSSLIAKHTLNSPTTEWPQFQLNAQVSGNTEYYMELTHNGCGNNSVGWVVRANTGDDWYNDGSAYIAGNAIDADFWFTLNQNIVGGSYEDYVYRWMYTEPDVLVFDHYPYLANGTLRSDYYANLEVIRRQADLGGVNFWSYIQSVGVNGAWRVPSESEMRYQVYSNLAYGAKGYIYFTYWTPASSGGESFNNGIILPDGTKNSSYTWAQQLNADVMNLGDTLLGLHSEAVYHAGGIPAAATALPSSFFWQPDNSAIPLLLGYFQDDAGNDYCLVVNKNTSQSQHMAFTIATGYASVQEISKATGQPASTNYDAGTGSMSTNFQPGEGKLFLLQ
ncbi:beta-galactosidase [Paenibacillus sp. J5C_2022]|uniref:beta-galactosidase n=1 Tax=Paenibacillus sp. J5C2022 TaxID=2977129 RepID=UPI0021D2D4A0|nr:beta-galactosidase [Paenibacillus sp. J5C2022]MCU6710744.1 beta-galactosidase [Paenibacillus sp. J5C2022]